MQRRSIIIALLIAVLSIIPVLAQAAPVGKFTSVAGDVDVTPPGGQAVPAKLGDPVSAGDIIRTKSKSKCEVTFVDGSVLRLAETSRLRVQEFSHEKEERSATLNLFRGKIQNIVKTAPGAAGERSKYEVQMPTAVTGVRGTNFFAFFQAGVSGAVFKEGTGYGYSLNRPQEVRTIAVGQAMLVTSPDLPPAVRPATALELNQHERDTTPSEKPKEGSKKEEEQKPDTVKTAKAEEGKKEEEQKAPAKTEEQAPETKTAAVTQGQETTVALSGVTPSPPTTTGDAATSTALTELTRQTTELAKPSTEVTKPIAELTNAPTTATGSGGSTTNLVPVQQAEVTKPVLKFVAATTTPTTPVLPVITSSKSFTVTVAPVATDQQIQTYSYSLDGSPFYVTSPTISLTGLSEGQHTLEITATSTAGLVSEPLTHSWTVDLPKPPGGGTPVLSEIAVSTVMNPPTDEGITTGTMTVAATVAAPEGLPAGPSGGTTSGVVGDNPYSGFLTLVSGSWEGLLAGIYVTGTGAGYITGELSGADKVGSKTLSGSGLVKRSGILGLTDVAPENLTKNLITLGTVGGEAATGFSLPVLGSVTLGGAIGPEANAKGELKGLYVSHPDTGTDRMLGIWGMTTTGGTYANASRLTEIPGIYGQDGIIDASTPYFMLGSVSVKDDLKGHVSIDGDRIYYLEPGYRGDISLAFRGKYDSTKTTANYDSAGAGTFTLDPLAFGGTINNGGFHRLQGSDFVEAGSLSGLWGGTKSLEGETAREILLMGKYSGRPEGNALFTADLTSDTGLTGNLKTSGFVGGAFASNKMETDFRGFYTRLIPDSKKSEAGFLVSGGNGSSLISGTNSGVWKVSDDVYAFHIEDFEGAVPHFPSPEEDGQTFPTPLRNEYPGGPDVTLSVEGLRHNSFTPSSPWGIWQMIRGGSFSGVPSISQPINTAWAVDNKNGTTDNTTFQIAQTTWDSVARTVSGNTALAVVNWQEAKTMIGAGNIRGTFNPDLEAGTWQTLTTGAWLETPKFLEMQSTEDGRKTLAALNIPAVQVGTANLVQTTERPVNNLSYVTLNNVGFYALSTGGVPRIFATDQISGSYETLAPAAGGPLVPLSGGGLNAYFGIRNWQNGIWRANLIGGGALSGISGNISFTGGATGVFGDGLLSSGTAAGTVIRYPSSTDITPPELGFTAKPALFTTSDQADFALSLATGANYSYSLDGATFRPLTNVSGAASLTFSGLADGEHTLAVVGADAAGNPVLASHTWTVELANTISNNVTLGDFMSAGRLFGRFDSINNLWQLTFRGNALEYSNGLPTGPWGGTLSGTLDTNAFSGFIGGISGSWEAVMSSLYLNNTGGIGYFRGSLSGNDVAGATSMSGTGMADMSPPLGLQELTPDNFLQYLTTWEGGTPFALPNPQDITVGGAFTSPSYEGTGKMLGITAVDTVTGRQRWLGVWQNSTYNGAYRNNSGTPVYTKDSPWEGIYGLGGYVDYDYYSPYYMLGQIKGTDDGVGHTGLTGELTYLDARYLGKIGLAYRGNYGTDGYESAGAGTMILEPLEFAAVAHGTEYYFDGTDLVSNVTEPIILGGINSLWTNQTGGSPVPFALLGGFSAVYDDIYRNSYLAGRTPSHIHYGEIASHNVFTSSHNTTYDGGAFRGFLGASHVPNNSKEGALDGIVNAIYLDPEGNAGFLEGSFTGAAYAMGDGNGHLGTAAGDVRLTQMASSTGLLPEDLAFSMERNWGGGVVTLGGSFSGNAGMVKADTVHFETAALVDAVNHVAQPWGIYAAKMGGTFEKPQGASNNWTATMGGWTTFGAYFASGEGIPKVPDFGYFLAQTAGLASGGKITSDLQGRFITETKIGEITGKVVGTYSDSSHTTGPWQAASLGTWTGRDLKFMSPISGDLTSGSYGAYRGDIGNTPVSIKLTWFAEPKDLDANLFLPNGSYQVSSLNVGDSAEYPFAKLDQDVFSGYGPETITLTQVLPGIYFYAVRNLSGSPALRTSGARVEVKDESGHTYAFNVPETGEGEWYNSFLLYNNKIFSIDTIGDEVGGGLTEAQGSYGAIFGSDRSLWNATAEIPFYLLGNYSVSSAGKTFAFLNRIRSRNEKGGGSTTYDGGAYTGWMAGTMGDDVQGAIYAFHIEPPVDGESTVGIIKGNFSGSTYPQIGMWTAEGSFFPPLNLGKTSITPQAFREIASSSLLYDGVGALTNTTGSPVGKFATPPFTQINLHRLVASQYNAPPLELLPHVGLWETEIRANADGLTGVPASLSMEVTGAEPDFDIQAVVQAALKPNNATNPTNYTISERVTGAWVNLSDLVGEAATGVLGGEILGTFNPAALTFQAAALGAWVETGKFREMASTEDGRKALATLNIPAIQVGTADLTGSGSFADGTMSVAMRDVAFFAYSTGAPARIWATAPAATPGVSGSYTGAPAPGWTVPLTGENYSNASGLSADFVIKKWDGFEGGKWGAGVMGSGTVDSKAIQFKGGAAGAIISLPVTGPGTFTGTGAGIVKP